MIIDGKKCASSILQELEKELKALPSPPKIVFILVGENPASHLYVRKKQSTCEKLTIISEIITFPASCTEEKLLTTIESLNQDPSVHAILVQMPLPPSINSLKVIETIDPSKDVDGFHPMNMGRLLQGNDSAIVPCTPLGVNYLLQTYQVNLRQKRVVIVGRSNVVGKPLLALLIQKNPLANATVTLAHSGTVNLKELTQAADVLISAVGKIHTITSDMVKKGAVVIDVGINRLEGKKITGDVDFENVAKKASLITPVPGGVGPMTIAMLLKNTIKCYILQKKKSS